MNRITVMAAVSLACIASGCGGNVDPNRPETYAVSGTVTYQGKAVEGALVFFHPADKGLPGAVGRTDADGRYLLTTFGASDGAVAGQYNVTVVRYDQPPLPANPDHEPSDYEAIADEVRPSAPMRSLLPPQYSVAAGSGLTATVRPGDANTVDLHLR